MSARYVYTYLVVAVLMIWFSAPLAEATIYQPPCMGTVSILDVENRTIHLDRPAILRDNRWDELETMSIGVTVNPVVFSHITINDSVIIGRCSSGGTVARLAGPGEHQRFATTIIGDETDIPVPLAGEFEVVTRLVPDCSSCDDFACDASRAEVTVLHAGSELPNRTFSRNESFEYTGTRDGCTLSFRFISGSLPAFTCNPASESHFIFDPTGCESIILMSCPAESVPQAGKGTNVTPSLSGTGLAANRNATHGGSSMPGFTVLPAILTIALVLFYRKRSR